jgi:hypothetical protein
MSEFLSWPVTPTNSMTDSEFVRIWGECSASDFLVDDNWVISETEEDDNTDVSTLEDLLDTYPKLILRLKGHQKQPHYNGHSMMYIEHRHYGHKSDPNALVRVENRPCVQSGHHTLKNVTAIDSQLTFGSFGEAELGKRNRWDTIPEFLLQNAKLLSWKWHRFDHQMEGIFEVPSINTLVTRNESSKACSGRPVSWFRWGGRYYNPAYLYTMKHDKEFSFQVWSTQDSHDSCVTLLPNQKRIVILSSKEPTTTVESWRHPCHVTHILCHGESPTIMRFPDEYIPSKGNPKRQKRARRKKTRGKSLAIVTNPNNLGYVTTFRVFFFHAGLRKWINLGVFPGNADAKTWVTIDLTAYNVVTNRLRVEPVDFHGSGAFKIEVWGPCKANPLSEAETKTVLEPVSYEITWPTTPEMRCKIWKAGRNWNAAPSDCYRCHGLKAFNSKRRGKQAKYAFQRECQDFVLT